MSIVTDGHWPDETDALLRALPEWFGIEESVRAYVNAAQTLPTVAARVDGQIVGVCLVRGTRRWPPRSSCSQCAETSIERVSDGAWWKGRLPT